MINLKNITKIYPPDITALRKVNLHIKPGEFVSIVGQSGTGKTTLVKLLISEEKADEGKIVIGGWDITNIGQSEISVLRRQIGVVFQDFKLLQKKTLFENVAFALQVCGESQKKINGIVPQVLKIGFRKQNASLSATNFRRRAATSCYSSRFSSSTKNSFSR